MLKTRHFCVIKSIIINRSKCSMLVIIAMYSYILNLLYCTVWYLADPFPILPILCTAEMQYSEKYNTIKNQAEWD